MSVGFMANWRAWERSSFHRGLQRRTVLLSPAALATIETAVAYDAVQGRRTMIRPT
jgi:hypothetical protein